MKNIFELLSDIHNTKPNYTLTCADEFSSFMACRWISMVSPVYAALINDLYNVQHKAFEDNQMVYDFMKTVMPKKYIGKVNYLKKGVEKKKAGKEEEFVERMANVMEIYKREVRELLELYPEAIKELKEDDIKMYKKKG